MEIREQAHKDYVEGMTLKAIAKKYDISVNTVKSWSRRSEWIRNPDAVKGKSGAPRGNHNSKGGPPGNHKAVKHGLFAKFLPQETKDLVAEIEKMSPMDILWKNICIKTASIIRAQPIMYVAGKDDVIKRRTMSGESVDSYEYREAYEQQATFLAAQSRAMATLTKMIKQYEEMCAAGLATEEQKLRIQKLRMDLNVQQDNDDKVVIIDDTDQAK